ncbi:hypothetical protein [Citrobacter pasteurii]|nr:hypothetical protein SF123566_8525 [Shigella flexneri 1235-66]CEJ65259.1 hypothetical protein [Citrobacter pasteurii]
MLCFQRGDGQMTDGRKDMIFHAGENTRGIISRLLFVDFMPAPRDSFKTLFR